MTTVLKNSLSLFCGLKSLAVESCCCVCLCKNSLLFWVVPKEVNTFQPISINRVLSFLSNVVEVFWFLQSGRISEVRSYSLLKRHDWTMRFGGAGISSVSFFSPLCYIFLFGWNNYTVDSYSSLCFFLVMYDWENFFFVIGWEEANLFFNRPQWYSRY